MKPAYCVITGKNHFILSLPNISTKFEALPRLKPFLSGPILNIGARNDSVKRKI